MPLLSLPRRRPPLAAVRGPLWMGGGYLFQGWTRRNIFQENKRRGRQENEARLPACPVSSDEARQRTPRFGLGNLGCGRGRDGPRFQIPDPRNSGSAAPDAVMGCAGGDGATLIRCEPPTPLLLCPSRVGRSNEIETARVQCRGWTNGIGSSGEVLRCKGKRRRQCEKGWEKGEGGESGQLPCIFAIDPLKLGLRTALLGNWGAGMASRGCSSNVSGQTGMSWLPHRL